MNTKTILILDCRSAENAAILQRVLRKIGPLSKYPDDEEIPLNALERVVSVMTNKYLLQPQWISMMYDIKECADGINGYYSCGVKKSDTHEWLGSVSGCTIYELFAKIVVLMYSNIRSERVGLRHHDG